MSEVRSFLIAAFLAGLLATACTPVPLSDLVATDTDSEGPSAQDGFAAPDRGMAEALAGTNYQYYSVEERTLLRGICMEDRGIPVTIRGNALQYRTPPGQEGQYEAASAACWEEIEERYPEAPPPTPQEEYNHNIEMAECMRSEGYDIPEAPTYDTWLDTRFNENSWYPYSYVPSGPIEEWDRLNRVCPQYGIGTSR